ncbi:MAG: glucokinase [Phycisphaerales bacterium]|nr:glucokinase [Phycisphaerales bacterium]
MILAADIGGTNTRLALFDDAGTLTGLREYRSQDHADLTAIVRLYIADPDTAADPAARRPVDRACFAVAGPVQGDDGALVSRITNLKWTVEQRRLADTLGLPPAEVKVINDLAANASGIDAVGGSDLVTLQPGDEQPGGRGIVSAGTGLGVGGAIWDGRRHLPCPSEGGHYSFGPRNELECDLLHFLAGREPDKFGGYVSWERVLSGPGLWNLFAFHAARNIGVQSLVVPPDTAAGQAAKLVSEAGMAGTCDRAVKTLDLFVSLYGAAAGNVAIQYTAINGLFVGGGIAPKILPKLRGESFLAAFLDKGPMRDRLLKNVPVKVITDEHCALRGAALVARQG